MASGSTPDPDREYRLIEQLELRIASADSDEKLETILHKFLPALLLKLASDTPRNRNLAIKVCQYINQRLKINASITLPVPALVKTFREAENAFVRRFGLIFIEQGLGRLPPDKGVATLPGVLQFAVPQSTEYGAAEKKMWAIAFDFLLDVLPQWRIPNRESQEGLALKETFALSSLQTDLLAERLCQFLLYSPAGNSAAGPQDDDFQAPLEKHFKRRSETATAVAKFLFTSIFTDQQRLVPATIMTVDANAGVSNIGDMMFKQCSFDLENDSNIDALFSLYRRARPRLQIKVLSILSRSQNSTTRSSEIVTMVEKQLTSPNDGLEAAKLRTALFSYLTWTVRVGHSLGEIGHKVQDMLKEYIHVQGWPSMSDRSAVEIELRGKAYESVGLLAVSTPASDGKETADRTLSLIHWLFTSLRCDTTRDIKSSIEEALGRVMNTATFADEDVARKLKDLLLWNILATPGQEDPVYFFPTVNSTKYPAVRFANKCFPFSDVDARYIDLLALIPSDRREVAEEGVRGLDPYWHASNLKLGGVPVQGRSLPMPQFDKLVARFFGLQGLPALQPYYHEPAVLTAAVMFCRNVLMSNILSDTHLATRDSPDWKQRIDALVANDVDARAQIRRSFLDRDQQPLIARLLHHTLDGLPQGSAACADLAVELLSLSPNAVLSEIVPSGLDVCARVTSNSNLQLNAARVFGILASLGSESEAVTALELDKCADWRTAIGEEVLKVRGHLLRATFCLTRRSLRGALDDPAAASLPRLLEMLLMMVGDATDKSIQDTAYKCLRQVALCIPPAHLMLLKSTLMDKLIADAKKENDSAVGALGPLIGVWYVNTQEPDSASVLDRVYALHEVKRAEFHFALGEALAVACAGFRSTSCLTEFDVDAPPPTWGYSETLMTAILGRIIEDCRTTKPSLKKAAAIWLLCLIQYCGDTAPVKARLRDCQAAFARLLSDRDEIVQETGSRGLGLVYERGDKQLQDDLVRDLVQSFTGTKVNLSGTVDEETPLFDAGALPTGNGQSVTTYKDIVNLATEMGDPSLVYKFMNLASNNAIWTSRAAFGRFGLGNVLADSTYLSENKKFYPKLFRYRFDPNPNVQRAMDDIWRALVKDANAVIQEHFDLIMDDLLKSVVLGKDWRAREASCAAIADLVQGRDVELYEKYLDDIWKVAFKVLDDVKETVRLAAMKLCRTLTTMLIRNLEVGGSGTTKRATTMLNHAMPFLLQQMDSGSAKEVQQYAIVTLLEVVKKSPPRSLQPFAPVILETLVLSLSSLEHESINYLHLNAEKYGLTAEKLDQMRVSSINASPVTEAVEKCLESITMPVEHQSPPQPDAMDGIEPSTPSSFKIHHDKMTPMQDAMQRLEGTYRSAIGLPSRVGLSRVMITLVVRHPTAFRPYADRFVQLTRKHLLDRNATVSIAFSTALGYLTRLASATEVVATSRYAQKLYFESQELAHRAVAGEIVQALSKAANDVFMNSATIFLPLTFIGRHDTDDQVREHFEETWKESVGGSRAINLYFTEIVALLSTHLASPLWPVRHACCFAVADLVSSMEVQDRYTDSEAALLWPVMQNALGGKTWEGKEKVIVAFPTFVRHAKSLWADDPTSRQMKSLAVREAKRTNVAYRPHAISALGEFALVRKDLDLSAEVIPYLTDLMDDLTGTDAMDLDAREGAVTRER